MRLCMTLLVRDEAKIIRENLEYHLNRGVDFFIAMDNLSTDETKDILLEYEKRGVLKYIFQGDDNYAQSRWVTQMARLAIEQYQADWVIHNDADEFWWPQKGDSLKTVLESVPDRYDGVRAKRMNFYYLPAHSESEPFYRRMTLRQVKSTNIFSNPLPRKVCHRGLPHVTVDQGNHQIDLKHKIPTLNNTEDIVIFHFPMRHIEDFKTKIKLGGAAYNRNAELPEDIGKSWRTMFDALEKGTFDTFLEKMVLTPKQTKAMLKSGEVVKDLRFKIFMEDLMDTKKSIFQQLRFLMGNRNTPNHSP